ncbi:hypothetical protein DW352_19180 [Pseudolabrys taiwanensis]|uniref:Uncharacterized protein n=1 Tax=Pseudolabrys taiwanensis TaxID=331696 RepID=A0A345ZZV7_9HYPH|nr:hypothetical protein [Pseudolabrys taiwanensis]AXK82454.1 hypothetical protein DW352_19180 [Pseudolabrys taiwanensis]
MTSSIQVSPIQVSPVAVTIVAVLSVIALLLWLLHVSMLDSLTGSDAAGNGMAQGFAAIAIILLWGLLALIALIAFVKGDMPGWAAVAAAVLIPVSGLVTFGVLGLMTEPQLAPYRWPLVIPAAMPPLVIAFCLWALLPGTHTYVPAPLAGGAAWGLVLLLCVAYLPMQRARDAAHAREAADLAKYEAALNAVPAGAPLWALTPFLDTRNYVKLDEVLARIRALPDRQAEAETMLARGDFPLAYLGRFDLDATPSLCEKARAQLRGRAAALTLAAPETKPFSDIAMEVDGAVAALRWLIDYDCAAMPEAEAWETMAKGYRDPRYAIYELRDLKDAKRLGRALYEDPEKFSQLTPRAHLKAWLKFADDQSTRTPAIAGAAKLDHRTADAIEILATDEFVARVLTENIGRLDLDPTPALCRAGLDNLRKQFAAVYRPKPDDPRPYDQLIGQLGRGDQFNALIWFASRGCDAGDALSEAAMLIKAYQLSPDGGLMLGRIEMLRKK